MAGRLCVRLWSEQNKPSCTALHCERQFIILEEIKTLIAVKTTAYFTVKPTVWKNGCTIIPETIWEASSK